jgi:hypothetical protein
MKEHLEKQKASLKGQITLYEGRVDVLNRTQKINHIIFTTLKKRHEEVENKLFELSESFCDIGWTTPNH